MATISAAAAWASTSRERARISRKVHSTIPSHNDATTAPAAIAEYRINWLSVWSRLMNRWLLCRVRVYHAEVLGAIGAIPAKWVLPFISNRCYYDRIIFTGYRPT